MEKTDDIPADDRPAPPRAHWRHDLARILIAVLIVAGLIAAGYFLHGPLKRLGPPQKCWEQKQIDGRLYNVNPCTGQFRLIGDLTPAGGADGAK